MELRLLRYFLTVAETGNFNWAAEKLHITQPTLSRQLAQMEEELGVTLFERNHKRISLTEEGLLLRRRAEEILGLVQKTEDELVRLEDLQGKIMIGCGESNAVNLLGNWMKEFSLEYPNIQFDIYTAISDIICEQMEHGLVDIGLLIEPVELSDYSHIRIGKPEQHVLVMMPKDPLTAKDSISPHDLKDQPLIFPRRENMQSELTNWLGKDYHAQNVTAYFNLFMNGAVLVQQGFGYLFAIEGTMNFGDTNQLISRPLTPALYHQNVLVWKNNKPRSHAVNKFIDYIQILAGNTEQPSPPLF